MKVWPYIATLAALAFWSPTKLTFGLLTTAKLKFGRLIPAIS